MRGHRVVVQVLVAAVVLGGPMGSAVAAPGDAWGGVVPAAGVVSVALSSSVRVQLSVPEGVRMDAADLVVSGGDPSHFRGAVLESVRGEDGLRASVVDYPERLGVAAREVAVRVAVEDAEGPLVLPVAEERGCVEDCPVPAGRYTLDVIAAGPVEVELRLAGLEGVVVPDPEDLEALQVVPSRVSPVTFSLSDEFSLGHAFQWLGESGEPGYAFVQVVTQVRTGGAAQLEVTYCIDEGPAFCAHETSHATTAVNALGAPVTATRAGFALAAGRHPALMRWEDDDVVGGGSFTMAADAIAVAPVGAATGEG